MTLSVGDRDEDEDVAERSRLSLLGASTSVEAAAAVQRSEWTKSFGCIVITIHVKRIRGTKGQR